MLRLESGKLEARAKGEGFILDPDVTGQRNRYALFLNDLLIDNDRVDEKGRIDMKEAVDSFPFTSLLGLAVKIIEIGDGNPVGGGSTQDSCAASTTIVLVRTVTPQDLKQIPPIGPRMPTYWQTSTTYVEPVRGV